MAVDCQDKSVPLLIGQSCDPKHQALHLSAVTFEKEVQAVSRVPQSQKNPATSLCCHLPLLCIFGVTPRMISFETVALMRLVSCFIQIVCFHQREDVVVSLKCKENSQTMVRLLLVVHRKIK